MAGSAVSEIIFFIAAIMISSAVAVTLVEVVDNFSADLGDEASVLRWEMRTNMEVINDPMYIPYDTSDGNLTLYLKNTGSGDLSVDDIIISANGTTDAGNDIWTKLLGGGNEWEPGKTVQVNFRVSGLREGVDYNGWAATSGKTSSGSIRGTAQDTIIFQIKEV